MLSPFTQPWAMTEDSYRRLLASALAIEERPEAFLGLALDRPRSEFMNQNGVAVIPVSGPLFRSEDRFSSILGESTYPGLTRAFLAALADESVTAIALQIDSPGGDALGLSELSDLIFEARGRKPIIAVVTALGTSAAYFIGSAADRVLVAPEAIVGSIGTVLHIVDFTKMDEEMGIEHIEIVSSQSPKKLPDPNTDPGRAQLQAEVDSIAQVFVEAVARNRGVTVDTVLSDFGQGAVFVGEEAVRAGLADSVGTVREVVEKLGTREPEPPQETAEDRKVRWAGLGRAAKRLQKLEGGEPKSHAARGVYEALLEQWRMRGESPDGALGMLRELPPPEPSKASDWNAVLEGAAAGRFEHPDPAEELAAMRREQVRRDGKMQQILDDEAEIAANPPKPSTGREGQSTVDRIVRNAKRAGIVERPKSSTGEA